MLSDPQLHYLDNAATTRVDPAVAQAIGTALTELWANPSSLYDPAVAAQDAVQTARARVAKTLHCRSDEIYFTARGRAGRAPFYAEKFFGIQRYSSLLSGDNKIRGGKFFVKTLKSLRGRVFPGAILQPSGDEKKPAERTGTDVSGHRNRGISVDCILHHERQVFLFRSLFRYKPHETENGILNGLKHKTKHTRFTTV